MTVRVRLFAVLRERAGADHVDLELPEGARVADALAALSDLAGGLTCVMAVNREYADADRVLAGGDELALIPPVSGGAQPHVAIRSGPLSIDALATLVRDARAGAVVTFSGVTREVERLEYEAYAEMAETAMRDIARRGDRARTALAAAAEHRVGAVPLGEPSVIVAASAPHREAAFDGAREIIDAIKDAAPIWKREVEGDERRWVEGSVPGGIVSGGSASSPRARRSLAWRGDARAAPARSATRRVRRAHRRRPAPAGLPDVRRRSRTGRDRPSRVAGFRVLETLLAWGGCSTSTTSRRSPRRAAAVTPAALLAGSTTRRRLGCEQLQLDSGVGPERHTAHRHYMRQRHGDRLAPLRQAALSAGPGSRCRAPGVRPRRRPRGRGRVARPPPLLSRASQSSAHSGFCLARSTTASRSDIEETSSTCSLMNHCMNCSLA